MLPRPILLMVLLLALAAAGRGAAQEPGRPSSHYNQAPQRAVQPASYAINDEEVSPASPPSPPTSAAAPLPLTPREKSPAKEVPRPAPTTPTAAVTTVAGSLAVVLGLFVILVWLSRRFAPAGSAALPKEVVELLGRTSLGGPHQMQLVRIGGKLLLVALSPHGARTLTEIVSAADVERLCELCRRQKPDSATASFRNLVEQIGGERTPGTFVDNSRRAPAAATAAARTRGGIRT